MNEESIYSDIVGIEVVGLQEDANKYLSEGWRLLRILASKDPACGFSESPLYILGRPRESVTQDCPNCNGTGEVPGEALDAHKDYRKPCPVCKGTGKRKAKE